MLFGTTSHLTFDKVHHQLEANIDKQLSNKCSTGKLDQVTDLKIWETAVCHLDEEMREELRMFKAITFRACNKLRAKNILGEPSHKLNAQNSSYSSSCPCADMLLKLTAVECTLLFKNEGCLKCCLFFVGHTLATCPKDFPDPAKYHPPDIGYIKRVCPSKSKAKGVNAILPTASEEVNVVPGLSTHPVAAVMGLAYNPVGYTASNNSDVLNDNDSDTDFTSDSDAAPSNTIDLHNTVNPRPTLFILQGQSATGVVISCSLII